VHNVTLASARRLWQYAISEREKHPLDPKKLDWIGGMAIAKTYKRGGKVRYDLVHRANDYLFIYYGVTEDGIHGEWRHLIDGEAIAEESIPEDVEPEPHAPNGTTAEYDESAGLVAEPMSAEPGEAESIHPLIIEEEEPEPVESPVAQLVETEPEPASEEPFVPSWFEQVASAEEIDHAVETLAAEVAEKSSAEPQAPATPPEETPSTAVVPAPPAPLVPKSRAQAWREQLDRAMEEARKARGAEKDPTPDETNHSGD